MKDELLNKIICGDNKEVLKNFEDNSFDSVATDPPYGISFMGKDWDSFNPSYLEKQATVEQNRRPRADGRIATGFQASVYAGLYDLTPEGMLKFQLWYYEIMKECFRVLKPGGHLISFGSPRTYHRMACAVEDAGFEIRDQIQWLFSSGFPKSLNIGKELEEWHGWGTALKPANEPIVLARKPLAEKTIVENVLKFRTGGINIDDSRIKRAQNDREEYGVDGDEGSPSENANCYGERERVEYNLHEGGRFPANVILECICDEVIETGDKKEPYKYLGNEYQVEGFIKNVKPSSASNYNDKDLRTIHTNKECPCYLLDQQTKNLQSSKGNYVRKNGGNQFFNSMDGGTVDLPNGIVDSGGASRFFYVAKASRSERNAGLKNFPAKALNWTSGTQSPGTFQSEGTNRTAQNFHPTVKPIQLMRYLVKMITPPHGIVLDPFAGSGTTGIACIFEEFQFVGIEKEEEYCRIAEARMKACEPQLNLQL